MTKDTVVYYSNFELIFDAISASNTVLFILRTLSKLMVSVDAQQNGAYTPFHISVLTSLSIHMLQLMLIFILFYFLQFV